MQHYPAEGREKLHGAEGGATRSLTTSHAELTTEAMQHYPAVGLEKLHGARGGGVSRRVRTRPCSITRLRAGKSCTGRAEAEGHREPAALSS
jgi:hypothetical protein